MQLTVSALLAYKLYPGIFIVRPGLYTLNGIVGGIRTPDPLVPNQMRYQAALLLYKNGRESGIRTHGCFYTTSVFKTGTLNRTQSSLFKFGTQRGVRTLTPKAPDSKSGVST